MTLRAAVFASGRGSNFQVLADRTPYRETEDRDPSSDTARQANGGNPDWTVVLLVTDRDHVPVLDAATTRGIPCTVVPPDGPSQTASFADRLLERLEAARVDLVLLAGYLSLVPPEVVQRYRKRMLNLHPALLPAFGGHGMYGRHVHQAVIDAGVRVSGATVHFVDEVYDRGPILAQWPVPVLPDDTPETLASRIHEVEHALFPAAVDAVARAVLEGTPPSSIPSSSRHFHLSSRLPELP